MQQTFEWPAICNFFSVPFSFFLQHRGTDVSQSWKLLGDLKQWTLQECALQKEKFYSEYELRGDTKCVVWGDPQYPLSLQRLEMPPACLYYKGDLSYLCEPSLSVIGSRQAAPCFLDWMDAELGTFLSSQQRVIVSGGARGIDQKATQVALRHQQNAVIVLPSGFDVLYPAELSYWSAYPKILFLSEYLPRQKMHRHHFLKRNRLVSSLTQHLLVVQCAIKSGSMITVKYAMEQGVYVATVPDFPGSYESSGNLKLLREGATLVSGAEDLQDFVKW
jgi:DNA processing protein